jgi:hypothetical protein
MVAKIDPNETIVKVTDLLSLFTRPLQSYDRIIIHIINRLCGITGDFICDCERLKA